MKRKLSVIATVMCLTMLAGVGILVLSSCTAGRAAPMPVVRPHGTIPLFSTEESGTTTSSGGLDWPL